MKYSRRIDPKKVDEITMLIEKCNAVNMNFFDRMFLEYKQISDATRLEHAAANYPVYAQDKSLKHDMIKLHSNDVRIFNKSTSNRKEEIIGIPTDVRVTNKKTGKETIHKIVICRIAEGREAIDASRKCKPYSEGYLSKEDRLLDMGLDRTLKRVHEAKRKKLMKLIESDSEQ